GEAPRRRPPPPAPPMPARASESEFEDPEDEDLAGSLAHDTPGAISIQDDDDEESTANGRGAMAASASAPSRPDTLPFGSRLPPPGSLGHVRLPTPNPGFAIPTP